MTAALSSAANSLSSLLRQTSITDHEEVLNAADADLKKFKGDLDAQHVKVVALLKLDRFADALQVLESGGDKLKERARLEWGYALYKAGQPFQAAEVARQGSERGMRHVEAQASYRSEDFRRAAELYAELASNNGQVENEYVDLRINSSAVDAQLEWNGQESLVQKQKPSREDLEAFETAYNAACGSIARDELGQAEVLLRRAKDLCNALEDLSEEDKEAEILPITVQQLYVLTKQGRLEEADQLASSTNAEGLSDASTRHIAEVNMVAAAPPQDANPFLTHRKIHRSPDTITPDKPFGYQSAVLERNNYALDLLAQKSSGTADATVAIISKSSLPTLDASINSLSVINAAAHAQNRSGKEALRVVLSLLEKRPDDVGLLLVVTQLYVLTGNHGSAITLLEAFFSRLEQSRSTSDLDVRYAPGLVGTLVSLYTARSQTSHVRTELAKTSRYWRHRSKELQSPAGLPSRRALGHFYKSAGTVLLDSPDPEDLQLAKDIFTDLTSLEPEDRYASAGLIAALASTAPSSIQDSQLAQLTPVERLVTSIDVSALENAGVAKPATTATPVNNLKRHVESAPPIKAKKIRSGRLPKDYDPSKTADPERWLPMRDRSYYRPKGKKGKQKQAMLMQGGVVAEERDASSSRPGTPAETKAGGGGKQQQKKKKGKGGKW